MRLIHRHVKSIMQGAWIVLNTCEGKIEVPLPYIYMYMYVDIHKGTWNHNIGDHFRLGIDFNSVRLFGVGTACTRNIAELFG